MGLGAVVVRCSSVLLRFIVPAVPVVMRRLPMVMCRGLMVACGGMMMFGCGMSRGRGHALPPVVCVGIAVAWRLHLDLRPASENRLSLSIMQKRHLRSHDGVYASQFSLPLLPIPCSVTRAQDARISQSILTSTMSKSGHGLRWRRDLPGLSLAVVI